MSTYTIHIEVNDDGMPLWLHDVKAEARLNAEQRATVEFLYRRYHSAQYACETTHALRNKFKRHAPLDTEAQRKEDQWERDAAQTELMLRENETEMLPVVKKAV